MLHCWEDVHNSPGQISGCTCLIIHYWPIFTDQKPAGGLYKKAWLQSLLMPLHSQDRKCSQNTRQIFKLKCHRRPWWTPFCWWFMCEYLVNILKWKLFIPQQRYGPLYIFHAARNVNKPRRSKRRAASFFFFCPRMLVLKVVPSYSSAVRSMWSHLCHLEFLQEYPHLCFAVKTRNRSSNSSSSRSTRVFSFQSFVIALVQPPPLCAPPSEGRRASSVWLHVLLLFCSRG